MANGSADNRNHGKERGYAVRGWRDLASVSTIVASLLTVLIACILWGLKLESELNEERNARVNLEQRVSRNTAKIDVGVLSVAKTEINHIKETDRDHLRRIERLEAKH
ncbi:MAG: hypothetical protein GY938_05465 [Ketobacter sp.]|nr:hypothetical protein [Ketobacter sp.]